MAAHSRFLCHRWVGQWLTTRASGAPCAGHNHTIHLPFETQFKGKTAFWTPFVIYWEKSLGKKLFQGHAHFSHYRTSLNVRNPSQSSLRRMYSKNTGRSQETYNREYSWSQHIENCACQHLGTHLFSSAQVTFHYLPLQIRFLCFSGPWGKKCAFDRFPHL